MKQKFTVREIIARPLIMVCTLLIISACSGASQNITPAETDSVTLNRIAVFPFKDMYAVYGNNVSYTCPLCGRSYIIGEVDPGGDAVVADQFMELLKGRNHFDILPPDVSGDFQSSLDSGKGFEKSEFDLMMETSRKLNADAFVLGRVYLFKNRIGTKFSVERPAAVAFDIMLISVPDGKIMWTGNFSETQESLSENLFGFGKFIRRGGRWISAGELSREGLKKIMKTFPDPGRSTTAQTASPQPVSQ